MTRTSSISGTLVSRQRSPVSVAAAKSFSAAFFAPLIGTVPFSGRPPSIRNTSRATGSGWYSQWKGRASAIVPSRSPSGAVTRSLSVPAFRDPDPQQRLLELRAGGSEVGDVVAGSLERPLGLTPRFLRALDVDLARHVRG